MSSLSSTRHAVPTGGRAGARRARREPSLVGRYLGYVGYFVGAGLVSGAVVHHPLDPARYTAIGAAGAALFLVAALSSELRQDGRPGPLRLLHVLGTSLALSFGIGMLSGGLQHFEDFPERAAVLVPAGLLLSFVAYTLKEARRPVRHLAGPLGLAVLAVALLGHVGLRQVAAGLPAETGGHHHGTAGTDETDEHEHAPSPTEPAATPSAVPSTRPSARSSAPVPPHGSPGHHH